MANFFKSIIDKAMNVQFPTKLTCNLCGREVFRQENFCADCEKEFTYIENVYCDTCGRKQLKPVSACASCKGWQVDKARSVFEYLGGAAKLIKQLKYDGKKYLADIMGEYMAKIYVNNFFAPDIITFVPMTDKEQFSRGFNHSLALAEGLAKIVDNEVIDLFIKKFDTKNQAGLTLEERQKNLKDSFGLIDKKFVKDKKVLITDDVLTTGATSGELAGLLKESGAKSVYLLTFASVSSDILLGRNKNREEQ